MADTGATGRPEKHVKLPPMKLLPTVLAMAMAMAGPPSAGQQEGSAGQEARWTDNYFSKSVARQFTYGIMLLESPATDPRRKKIVAGELAASAFEYYLLVRSGEMAEKDKRIEFMIREAFKQEAVRSAALDPLDWEGDLPRSITPAPDWQKNKDKQAYGNLARDFRAYFDQEPGQSGNADPKEKSGRKEKAE